MKNRKAFITGISSTSLRKNEIKFLKKHKPWGVILFSRNIKTIKQTQILTQSIKNIFNNNNYPILIDEEGGRISRLRKFIDSSIFSAKYFGDIENGKPKSKFFWAHNREEEKKMLIDFMNFVTQHIKKYPDS